MLFNVTSTTTNCSTVGGKDMIINDRFPFSIQPSAKKRKTEIDANNHSSEITGE